MTQEKEATPADTKQLKEDELMLVKFNIENESTRILALTPDMTFLLISGLCGTNIKTRVKRDVCLWFNGQCLFKALDGVEVAPLDPNGPFRNKVSANKGPSSSREFDRAKKVDRSSSLPNSSRHEYGNNGSAKVVHPPGSTAASSGRSSSTEHNQTSDDETGAVTHRTLPVSENWSIRRIQCSQYGVLMGFPCVGTDTPYLLYWIRRIEIVMENPNHLNEPNEAIPEVNPVVPEWNQVVDIHDPNEMVDIPDDIDLVDYDEEDPDEDPEEDPKEEPEEDVDIELKDDAELIFPYEVEGDKTPPPRDVSSDSVSSDFELEDEEVDVVPEATVRTITQKPYAIRDFPRGLFKVGESSSARDSSHVDVLAPWALRRDLEASRAQARVMEDELGTCQTEIALLKSKNKIREKERELLNYDLENVERALGNVLERMSVLESGKNATLKKRLD
ncbi:hypothetical protein Tco_0084919 [Tanacetum coccineum]